MFRQGLRRCALAASRNGSSTPFLRIGQRIATTNASAVSVTRSFVPMKNMAIATRLYSSEASAAAAATEEPVAAESSKVESESFADLEGLGVHPNLLKAIVRDMKYDTMTPVQAKTIQPALKGTDIVAQARTGTGKTIAFLLPLLQRMIEDDPTLAARSAARRARSSDIRGIILSPTRELAEQIAHEARAVVKHTGLVVQSAVGGTQKSAMLRRTQREGCHLLVATPGRLLDLLRDSGSGIAARKLSALVLDEADRMLDVGFERELNDILEYLPNRDEKTRQTLLVSATIPDNVIRLARSMVRADDFEFVQTIAENEALTHDRIPQHVVAATSWANILPSVFELFDREIATRNDNPEAMPFKAIVYLNTTALTEVAGEMAYHKRRDGKLTIPTYAIQSQLTQMQRSRAADAFRRAKSGILFSSDVTARGMDFPNVTHVIQVDTPRDRESYIHRLGRTGRQEKDGEGWIFLPPTSMRPARKLLGGLPLKPNKTLTSFDKEPTAFGESEFHQDCMDLYGAVPKNLLEAMYKSIFGGITGHAKEDIVDDLNDWAVHGWGWRAPPQVSRVWASKMGLSRTNLNIESSRPERRPRTDDDDAEDNFDGDGLFGNDRGSSRSGDRGNRDPFAEMGRRVRRDDNRFSGSRGSGGGFNRGRGSGGDRRQGNGRGGRRNDRNSYGGRGRSEQTNW